MESILQLYGLAMVVLPVYAFVSLRKRIRYERLAKRVALMHYVGLVVAPVLAYAVAFGLAVGVETVTPLSVVSEEAARSFVLAMVLGVILWLLATTIFALALFLFAIFGICRDEHMIPADNRTATEAAQQLRIVTFEPSHAEAFRTLNLDWIEEFFAVEDLDRVHLFAPQESFIDTGGAILMAELNGEVVGCCGLLSHGDNVYEVSKMAVKREYRGAGIGSSLLAGVIDYARCVGARRLEIISSTRLEPAIHLYKRMGFVEVPLESDTYARGNIALVLTLDAPA